ncbi:MAG: pyridoxamine 5'-phosphate oxidase family protein [Hyphomonadaceae bacterium]|nr:pyridoxamine 5'-phosphate oxidase family protein [Hyphomonadaceae bacterium]
MGHRFAELAFTENVKKIQERDGSREGYARFEEGPANHDRLGPAEAEFLAARDSFYMATVSETGWPYVQHRGGPAGFIHVLDEKTIAFADFRGNRQFVSVGNLSIDNRVSLILVDYPNRKRLKVLGRARIVDGGEDPALLSQLEAPDYRARLERAFVITVEAFDWNCPQHITPRFTLVEVEQMVAPLKARIAELEAALREGAESTDV